MSRPRRRSIRAHGDEIVTCDSTALALVGGEGDAEIERAARTNEPEEIDTEEDDAEFEERAHWGRRRAGGRKKCAKKKAIEDKSQPKINLFCVVQTAVAKENSPSEALPPLTAAEETRAMEDVVTQTEEDGNGGSSVVEVVVHTEAPPALAGVSSPTTKTDLGDSEMTSPLLSPTMLSGRPKRQAVLKAEHAQLQAATEPLFTTPPAVQPTKKSSASKATLDGEPERKVVANGNGLTSSGRKRKLEMASEKKASQQTPPSAQKTPSKTRPSVFFMTEEQKKQVIEIEAIESFKEQLREQRERDLAFFGNRDVQNPFFKARAPTSSTQRSIDVDAPEVIEVLDSPEPSPAKQRKSKWSKELDLFPILQHVQREGVEKKGCNQIHGEVFNLPRKCVPVSDEVVVVDDGNADMDMEPRPARPIVTPDEVDAQVPFADPFWLLSSPSSCNADDVVLASLSGHLSTDELVEKLSQTCGIKEKRIRKTLAALESARTKRQEKLLNLSLVDKYLPVETAGMIGNKVPLKKLAAWLTAWKIGGSSDRDRNYDDSLFAFEGDDSEEDEDGSQLYRLFILEGDIGAGKSAAVYACADELGYEIIEINAGQLRTGKAVVDIAGEATQSTRVLHGGGPVNDKKNKKSKSKKRRKDVESAKPSHLSLVLFEDVDLVFEEDKGFLTTLGSIARHSKCPIVVTCRHLPDNFPSTPPSISERLVRPSTREFIAWLSLVAHLEGIALSHLLVSRLAELFACDIRRTLQFLQTYRHRIDHREDRNDSLLTWAPCRHLPVAADASDPITIADSQDEESLPPPSVPAWSRSTLRSFDLLNSNFLPLLCGSVCDNIPASGAQDTRELAEKLRHVECLNDVWSVLDSVSLVDEWESRVADEHRTNADNGQEGADFFHADVVTRLTLDVRMLSLSNFVSNREHSADILSLLSCSLADGVERALGAARDDSERAKKAALLATLKTKLELPFIAKGSERVGRRFCMDYVPLLARIVDNSEPFQESRRRTSRRNHYLGDVLLDMSALDDLRDVQASFLEEHTDPNDATSICI